MKDHKPYFLIAVIVWALFMTVVIVWDVDRNSEPEPEITPQVVECVELEYTPTPEPEPIYDINRTDVEMLARLTWGEARGCTTTEQAAIMWCVLNRVDSDSTDFPDTIAEAITQPRQFYYKASFPLEDKLVLLAEDVLYRWYKEKDTGEIDGRVLAQGYCWFSGDGQHNHFRDAFKGGTTWDWSLESPYEDN